MGKPFQEEGLTVTLDSGLILDLYDGPPFTRKPTCDLLLCGALRRFYLVYTSDSAFDYGRWGWVDDRGQLRRDVDLDRRLRIDLGISGAQLVTARDHLRNFHCVRVVPHRYEGVKLWVPHNPRDVAAAVGYVGAGTDLSHLL